MCDPVTAIAVVGGMVAAKALAPSAPGGIAAQPDPAAERAKAETDAANAANQKLADDKRIKRANVLASGGSSDALGAGQSAVQPGAAKTTVLGGAGA